MIKDLSLPCLLIRLKRAPDGSAAITCIRADRSRTWQRQTGAHGAAFPSHDLTHYDDTEIERVLSIRSGVLERWAMTRPGQTLELEFTRTSAKRN